MMHHAISKGRGTDFAVLGFMDKKLMIGTGAVGLVTQFCLEMDQFISDVMLKICRRITPSFAFRRFAIR